MNNSANEDPKLPDKEDYSELAFPPKKTVRIPFCLYIFCVVMLFLLLPFVIVVICSIVLIDGLRKTYHSICEIHYE